MAGIVGRGLVRLLTVIIFGLGSESPDSMLIAIRVNSDLKHFLCTLGPFLIVILVQYDWFSKDYQMLIYKKSTTWSTKKQSESPKLGQGPAPD